jgi:4-amino-4-deoxychorismate lyase
MTRFIESIYLSDGELRNLGLHQRRLKLTQLAHFGFSVRIDLKTQLERRSLPAVGVFKVRVTYGREIESIEVEPYTRHRVQRIELVEAESLDYRFKYADRRLIDALRHEVGPGAQPVVVQRGLLTDATYANICVFDGERWLTPVRPLLEGTARAAALAAGQVQAAAISVTDFRAGRYQKMKLINCMTLFDEAEEIPFLGP